MPDDILIVGGGLAGLSTAYELNQVGHNVTLIEKRGRLGGRASSYQLDSFPLEIDNCQHVLTGSCRECLRLIRETTGTDSLESRRSIPVIHGREMGQLDHLELTNKPPPFHALSLLLDSAGSWTSAIRNGINVLGLKQHRPMKNTTAMEWLKRYQDRRMIKRLWRPLTTSALNETLERVSLEAFRKWLFTGLLNTTRSPSIYIPSHSLKDLYGNKVGSSLQKNGVDINRGTRAKKINPERPSVTLEGGNQLTPDYLVSALPDRVLWARLPDRLRQTEPYSRIQHWEHAPIISVHLLFGGDFNPPDFALLSDSPFEWMFALRQPSDRHTYLQCVKSAAWDAVSWDKDTLVEKAKGSVAGLVPEGINVTNSRVIKEKNATLSMTPRVESERFGPRTPQSDFYVAGDWTAQPWPPTMESAVRSGMRAASCIDSGVELPAPDPEPSGWLRFLNGIHLS